MMTSLSLPLHPLVVHAAVLFIPLAALCAMAFVLRPAWRSVLRFPTAIVTLVALVALFVTRATGDQLAHATPDNKDLIERHDQLAGLLTAACVPLFALTLFACWSFASATSLWASGRGVRTGRYVKFARVVKWLIVLLALATLVLTVLTGHAGAVAAWTN